MRWLLQRGNADDQSPRLVTLQEPAAENTPSGIAALPGGALSVTARSAKEARDALAELQRLQQELLTARARAAGDGIATFGITITRQIRRPGRHLRRAGATAGRAARGFRPGPPVTRVRDVSATVFDGLDAALFVAQTAGEIDDALRLVRSAIEAVGTFVAEIDLGDLDFD